MSALNYQDSSGLTKNSSRINITSPSLPAVSDSSMGLAGMFSNEYKKPSISGLSSDDLNKSFSTFGNNSSGGGGGGGEEGGFFSSLTGDNSFGANVSGLASAFASLVSLPQMLKNAKLNYKINKTGFRDSQADRKRFIDTRAQLNAFTSPEQKDGMG